MSDSLFDKQIAKVGHDTQDTTRKFCHLRVIYSVSFLHQQLEAGLLVSVIYFHKSLILMCKARLA